MISGAVGRDDAAYASRNSPFRRGQRGLALAFKFFEAPDQPPLKREIIRGRHGYLQAAPFTREPVASLDEINRWMAERQRERFDS